MDIETKINKPKVETGIIATVALNFRAHPITVVNNYYRYNNCCLSTTLGASSPCRALFPSAQDYVLL